MPTELKALEITEVSIVEAGDNPPAGVRVLKSAPPSSGVPMDGDMVNKAALEAEVAKRTALEAELAKHKQELDTLVEKAAVEDLKKTLSAAGLSETLVTPLRTVQKSAEAAFAPLLAELTRLQKAATATATLTARIGDVGKTSTPAKENFQQLVKAEMAKGKTEAQATVDVAAANPDLYSEVAYGR